MEQMTKAYHDEHDENRRGHNEHEVLNNIFTASKLLAKLSLSHKLINLFLVLVGYVVVVVAKALF